MTGNKYGSAAAVRREVAEYLRPPRRMPVAEGIKQFMFVPRGANTAVQQKHHAGYTAFLFPQGEVSK